MPVVRDVFCPFEQKTTAHFVSFSKISEELIMKCPSPCEHFIKFPSTITPPQVTKFLEKYSIENRGQIKAPSELELVSQARAEEEILSDFSNPKA